MTLEELKRFREKCREVQNTLIRDINYIREDIKETENTVLSDLSNIADRIKEYIELMPKHLYTCDENNHYLHEIKYNELEFNVGDVRVKFGEKWGTRYFALTETDTYGISSYEYIGFVVTKDGIVENAGKDYMTFYSGSERGKKVKLAVCKNWDKIEKGIQNFVEEINKKMNNYWIETNKYFLDRAESLKR